MKNITFINAGAGSGKTYRLTTDLAQKLTQGGLDPSQVILTTYTELAAAEIREKARKEILNAKDANNVPVAADVRIKNATQLDNAFIGTVHAISFRFIRKYWYLLNYGADIQPMSDQNQDFYMSQSISDIVTDDDRKVFREFRATFNIKDSYSHPDHLFWLPELKAIVDKMEYYDINNVADSIKESINTAQNIFCGWTIKECLQKINDFLPSFKDHLANINSKKSAKYQHTLELLNYYLGDAADFRADGLKDCMTEQIGTAQQKRNFYDTPDYQNALKAYNQSFISIDFLPLINKYLETIFNLAVRWQKALLTYKQENHIISFDDMEKIFLSMLIEPQYKEVQDDISNNFRLLMVDEFQDSNPIQLKIFNRISELIAFKGGESIWVGDPKQAIYGFRGSDSRFISEILSKFKFDEKGNKVPMQGTDNLGTDQLSESWRSRPALVDFSNRIFLEPFKKSGLKEKQIVLEAHHKNNDTMGNEQALYVWRTEQEKSEPRARMLAAKIKELLDSHMPVHHQSCDKPTSEITYRDIAVLCYSNAECNKVAAQLRKIGLPASCEETNLMQCIEVYLLKTLLLFVQNPSNKMLRAELAMMLYDATTEDMLKDRIKYVSEHFTEEKGWDGWMEKDSGHQYAETIAKLKTLTERYQNLSVFDAVVAIHEELDLNNIVAKWGDITQRKHNLATVVNMAKAYDDMCLQMGTGSSILGFINYLTVTKPENKPDNSANTIKVLTYHHSKGLEWPVVILYQLWKDMNNEEDLAKKQFCGVNVCRINNQTSDIFTRQHYINLFPAGTGGSGNSKMPELMLSNIYQQPLFKDIQNRTSEEALRLLYVGVTRAKDILVALTSKKANVGDDIPSLWPANLGIGDGSSIQPFGTGYNETLVELAESIYPSAEESTKQYRCTSNTPSINDEPPLILSPSIITEFKDSFTGNVSAGMNNERIIDTKMFAGESSDAIKGTFIHNIFASYKDGDDEGNLQRTTQTIANFGFQDLLQYKERLLESVKWLYGYLTRTYGPYTLIEKECPLLYALPSGQVLRGEIDLLWHYKTNDGDEKCVLIDYKTFPGRNDQLEEHTKKYYVQLSAYRAALIEAGIKVADTLIYYPVQGHVRKLTNE